MQLQIDSTYQNTKYIKLQTLFLVKEDHKLRSMRRNKGLTPHVKITKRTEHDSSILEHQMSNEMLRPTPAIMIKLTELAEDYSDKSRVWAVMIL